MTHHERDLDRALAGKPHGEDVAPLAETAAGLRSAFAAEVPEARAESLFFTSAAGLRKRSPLFVRLLIPVLAVASVLAGLVLVSRSAVPGDSLYPVRGALKKVGLATAPVREIDREIRTARNLLTRAEFAVLDDPDRAEDLAHEAIDHLGDAWDLVEDLDPLDRTTRVTRIRALERRANAVIVQADIAEDRLDELDDDSSGKGSGGDDDGDDGDDDSSGSGSDDSGGDDDSSGSGSGGSDDDSGSGSSGSGSSGSGSGDDSSGKG
jgi:uncharacterized membrane protein YgcG